MTAGAKEVDDLREFKGLCPGYRSFTTTPISLANFPLGFLKYRFPYPDSTFTSAACYARWILAVMPSKRGPPLNVPIPQSTVADLPPISALFLIDFDVKAGYTIAWKRAESGLEIEGLVEYKSLPSGLHTVKDDLIYFVHDGAHAGLSAFVNEPCEEEEARHARMIAVGVLVPLSYGRLGRAWRHAEGLKKMAAKLAKHRQDTTVLEQYWDAHKAKKSDDTSRPASRDEPLDSPSVTFSDTLPSSGHKSYSRKRSISDGASLTPADQKLSPYHPAWSLTRLLDEFGPLIFPIQRAALLRKRILISCHAPVHEICDFVYNISVLSNIPLSVTDILPATSPTQRLRPLFSIGVHDIPFLMEDLQASKSNRDNDTAIEDAGSGWIACTTDSILAMKDTLWDMLITVPPAHASDARDKVWPTVECPRGEPIKATQRDLRRFNTLRAGLARLATPSSPSVSRSPASKRQGHDDERNESMEKITEPLSWSALAYNGYMWWASAGEQIRSAEQEETSRDAVLLADLHPHSPSLGPSQHSSMSMQSQQAFAMSRSDTLNDSLASLAARRTSDEQGEARIELATIAYFHRLTAQVFSILADIYEGAEEVYADDPSDPPVRRSSAKSHSRQASISSSSSPADEQQLLPHRATADSEDGDYASEDDGYGLVTVDSRSVEMMGLDVWSPGDAEFVKGLMRLYFGRSAKIEGKGVEICGVRVC